jgi:hypothetical protein
MCCGQIEIPMDDRLYELLVQLGASGANVAVLYVILSYFKVATLVGGLVGIAGLAYRFAIKAHGLEETLAHQPAAERALREQRKIVTQQDVVIEKLHAMLSDERRGRETD